ncbi:family 10 glycosylhydrolase [Spirillospora sp. NPDC029432]|uniref:glycoside hydrolase family 10 protein n=1 Tax=Spirillospora sp. NPDC029432 TaxID=3154599 RepID=UPI0034557A7C
MARRTGIITRTAAAALTAGALTACLPASGTDDGPGAVPPGAKAECPAVKAPGDSRHRQLRGMWIATVGGIDWPKGKTEKGQKDDYRRLLDTAQAMNLNAVFVQIRPNSDAFYPSPYEPWSQWITGTPGKDPGYDVLGFMLKEAHARGLEFHAWFNPYRISRQADLNKLAPNSPARKHPDWVRKYGKGLWYDPGLPQVRELATNAVMDVVRKYDIDAVHFDDYFYPYPEGGAEYPDQATYKTYGQGLSKADWRRRNVDTLVRDLSGAIHKAKPHVRFGISPFGVWRNTRNDRAGSPTDGALQSYDDQYADTRKWIKEGWIDYVTPQLYWTIGDRPADYAKLVDWWARQVEGTDVELTIGQAAYRVGESGPWKKAGELSRHLDLNKRHPAVRGDVYFSAASLAGNKLRFAERLRKDHYGRPAIPPVVRGRGGKAPTPVQGVQAKAGDDGVKIQWRPAKDADAYAVYRVEGQKPACAPVDPATLVAHIREGGGILDRAAKRGTTYTYYVTALDRLHHESAPARGATVAAAGG